jgi:hypothetical protein
MTARDKLKRERADAKIRESKQALVDALAAEGYWANVAPAPPPAEAFTFTAPVAEPKYDSETGKPIFAQSAEWKYDALVQGIRAVLQGVDLPTAGRATEHVCADIFRQVRSDK